MRRSRQTQCEDFFCIRTSCSNQRIKNKKVKNTVAFKDTIKGLGIKCNETQINKDNCIDECVGVVFYRKDLKKVIRECGYKKMLHMI